MFCKAPTYTAASSGVNPSFPITGASGSPNNMREKKPTPVISNTVGVIFAATPHPYLSNINWLTSIIVKVAIPVAVEKSPIKDEYSFGLGNCTSRKGECEGKKEVHNKMASKKTKSEKSYILLEL